jgi:Protein of unknown function (DUF2934)
MPRKKVADAVVAPNVPAARRKRSAPAAQRAETGLAVTARKPRSASSPRRTKAAAVGDSLLMLNDALTGPPTADQIAERAYFLWLERGCPEGSAERDWIDAELELSANR